MTEKVPVRVGLCPNGYFLFIPFAIVLFTFALTAFGTLSCQYVSVEEDRGLGAGNETSRGIGLWVQEKLDSENREEGTWRCESLDQDDYVDGYMKTARACSFIALCVGLGSLIMICIFGVIRVRESALRHMYVCLCCLLTGISMCMVLTVFVFAADVCDDNDCEWNWGATLSMIASGGWAVAGFVLCCCTPIIQREREVKEKKKKSVDEEKPQDDMVDANDDDDDDNQSTEFVEVAEKTERDGAVYRITKTTITHRNGRKTVTQKRDLIKAAPAAAIIAARDKMEDDKEEEEEEPKEPVPVVVNKSEKKEEEPAAEDSLSGPEPVVVNKDKTEEPEDDSPRFVDHADKDKNDPPSRSMMMADQKDSAKAQDRKGGFFCGDMEFCS